MIILFSQSVLRLLNTVFVTAGTFVTRHRSLVMAGNVTLNFLVTTGTNVTVGSLFSCCGWF